MSDNPTDYSEDNCWDFGKPDLRELRNKSAQFLRSLPISKSVWVRGKNLANINNEENYLYPQKKIKSRVIACLKDMVKAGY